MNIYILLLFITVVLFLGEDIKPLYYSVVKPNKNSFDEVPLKKRNIAIVTAENRDDQYIKYHDLNCKKYARIHGYSYFRLNNCDISESSTYWCKIYKVKKFLDSGNYDYVVWLDSDTIFTDFETSLDYIISKIGEPDIIIGHDYNSYILNAGIFFIKNSEIGNSFINECISTIESKPNCIINGKEQGMWAGMCYEQGVMNKLIREKYNKEYYLDEGDLIRNIIDFDINKDYKLSLITHLPNSKNDVRTKVFKDYV
jgi:hypothetical protein